MFNLVGQVQYGITFILGIAALGLQLWALVDCVRHRPDAFVAAGKHTKTLWLVILIVATLIGFISIYNPLNLIGILAVVGAAVYLADVRPALHRVTGRGSGRGSNNGPYGPW